MNYLIIIFCSIVLVSVFFFFGIRIGIRIGWQQAMEFEKPDSFEFDTSDGRSD